MHQLVNYNIVEFLLKINDGRDRRPNYAGFVVWSASYASAKTLEHEGSISSACAIMGNYYSYFFSLIHIDEFSFKKMRTWCQSKISSCCLCIWCKSRE